MPDLTGELRAAGLMPHQADFLTRFLAVDAPRYQQLTAPPGLGKTRLVGWLVRELVVAENRALIIAPRFLVEQVAARCREEAPGTRVVVLTKPIFRELVSSVPVGEAPWPAGAVFIASLQFVNESDVRQAILQAEWGLLVVDDEHELLGRSGAIVKDLVTRGKVARALFLSGGEDATHIPWLGSDVRETRWTYSLMDWEGRPLVLPTLRRRKIIDYERGADEQACVAKLLGFITSVRSQGNPVSEILASATLSAASSSTSALEQTLLRRRSRLTHQEPDASWMDLSLAGEDVSSGSKLPGAWSDLEAIAELIECLDSVKTDGKSAALVSLLTSLKSRAMTRVCVFTQFLSTANYLAEAVEEAGLPVLLSWGGLPLEDRISLTATLAKEGGIFITTEAASPGLEEARVSIGINYDLPRSLRLMDQRWARLYRLGDHRPITMYAMRDVSRSIGEENKVLQQFGFIPDN